MKTSKICKEVTLQTMVSRAVDTEIRKRMKELEPAGDMKVSAYLRKLILKDIIKKII